MTSAGVSIGSGAKLALANNPTQFTRTLLTTPSLSFSSATSTLDLGSNDLDVPGGSLSAITGKIAQGYNLTGGENWGGAGITSSAAAGDTTHTTALGIIQNNQSGTTVFKTTFDGAPVAPSDILVKYTYFGDANLDGKVDGSDYSLIDAGYVSNKAGFIGTRLTGWLNGDFNYDGTVDGSDYALIDNSFNVQGSTLSPDALVATATAEVAAVPSPVPEPTAGILAIAHRTFDPPNAPSSPAKLIDLRSSRLDCLIKAGIFRVGWWPESVRSCRQVTGHSTGRIVKKSLFAPYLHTHSLFFDTSRSLQLQY